MNIPHFITPTVDPPRSCDHIDGGHMTTSVRRRSKELVSRRFSYFNFDGF